MDKRIDFKKDGFIQIGKWDGYFIAHKVITKNGGPFMASGPTRDEMETALTDLGLLG